MSPEIFARQAAEANFSELDTAIGILWYLDEHQANASASALELAQLMRDGGRAMPNVSRLKKKLAEDSRSAKAGPNQFRINARSKSGMDQIYRPLSGPLRPKDSGSVLPIAPFNNARKYTRNVLHQINASYDDALFDCCAVMCRRLFETLIIDSFDKQGALDLIKGKNGEILMLSGLISVLEKQTAFRVGRQTKQAASKLKNIGDWSAHNRTFMAQQSHIDSIANDLSVATMDLLHLSGQD